MRKNVPVPVSGGLILTYKCTSRCRHCLHACSSDWEDRPMSHEDLGLVLGSLAGKIMPAPHGPQYVDINHGLHITGGEPFMDFDLLCRAVEMASGLKIPSLFVETNCYWAVDDETTRQRLSHLKALGLQGIMISVNPHTLEHVPFERTERAVKVALEILGAGTMLYQLEHFRRFKLLGLTGTVRYEEYMEMERRADFPQAEPELFVMGRAPYAMGGLLADEFPPIEAANFLDGTCPMPVARGVHNHFDCYGNYVAGFCSGLSYGDCRHLDDLIKEGIETDERPVLGLLMDQDMRGLMALALDHGYSELRDGYYSRCHLCEDIRRFLALEVGGFPELSPLEFYRQLGR